MAANVLLAGEDFIDMEISSYSSNFLCHSQSQPREFEFQMSFVEDRSEAITSPADELFYKGKLLPLHLPPRLQMVEKLLQNSPSPSFDPNMHAFDYEDELFSTPLATSTKPTPTTSRSNTPFESCQVSRELNPDEYNFGTDHEKRNKKSWRKKLMKKSSIGSTLRASRAYLRSLFRKSGGCSCETYYAAASTKVADESSASKGMNMNVKAGSKKLPFGQIQKSHKEKSKSEDRNGSSNRHRRSFSVGLKLTSSGNTKLSSSSFPSPSPSSSSFSLPKKSHASQHLKRSNSASSERENSIQGAIAHCKKSQAASDVATGLNSLSSSTISVCDDQERHQLCTS